VSYRQERALFPQISDYASTPQGGEDPIPQNTGATTTPGSILVNFQNDFRSRGFLMKNKKIEVPSDDVSPFRFYVIVFVLIVLIASLVFFV
jgi:hypothetical protein